MNRFGLSFHHLALAIREPEAAHRFLTGLGYSAGESVYDPEQRVNLTIFTALVGHPDIEVVSPADVPGPLDAVLKCDRERIYHVCYTSEDPAASVAAMREAGLRVMPVSPEKPAVLFGNSLVCFHYVQGIGLIEILHRQGEKKAGPCG